MCPCHSLDFQNMLFRAGENTHTKLDVCFCNEQLVNGKVCRLVIVALCQCWKRHNEKCVLRADNTLI